MSCRELQVVEEALHVKFAVAILCSLCSYSGTGLSYRASLSWGSKTTIGYGGHVFPVVIGETGSFFYKPEDLNFYNDFALYLNNESYENDGQHAVIRDLFWW